MSGQTPEGRANMDEARRVSDEIDVRRRAETRDREREEAQRRAAIADGEAGQARAADGATDDWKAEARSAVHDVGRRFREFDADDVWEYGGLDPNDPRADSRALGPVMSGLARRGVLVDTGRMRKSRRRHGTRIPVWRYNG